MKRGIWLENVEFNPDLLILEVEMILESVFDKYNSVGKFLRQKQVYFIYKNAVKFVPEKIKGQIQELFDLLELLEAAKEVMNVLANLEEEKGSNLTRKYNR